MTAASARLEPGRALRALCVLTRDPEDTSQVFEILEAFSGPAHQHLTERVAADATGARLLRERKDLLSVLEDRARLEAMPQGSLAHAYLAFLDAEGIDAAGLVEASRRGERGRRKDGTDVDWVRDRMRDTHDLWHTVTGYRGDLVGEASLLAFSLAQTHNPAIALIVLMGLLKMHDAEATRTILEGFRRGRRAAWLPALEWESLLAEPLHEVRARLGVGAPPRYADIRPPACVGDVA